MLPSVARKVSRSMSTTKEPGNELPVKELIKKETVNQPKEVWRLVKEQKKPEKSMMGY